MAFLTYAVRIANHAADPSRVAHLVRAWRRELLRAGDAKGLAEDLEGRHRVCVLDGVADRARVLVDLVVVAALEELVAEEVDLVKVGLRQIPQAEGLVPALREEIEGDLPRTPRSVDVSGPGRVRGQLG